MVHWALPSAGSNGVAPALPSLQQPVPRRLGKGQRKGRVLSLHAMSTIRTPPCCSLGGQEACGSEMGRSGRGRNNLGTGEIEPWQRFLLCLTSQPSQKDGCANLWWEASFCPSEGAICALSYSSSLCATEALPVVVPVPQAKDCLTKDREG